LFYTFSLFSLFFPFQIRPPWPELSVELHELKMGTAQHSMGAYTTSAIC
jgi:hypothetical protein